MIRTLIAALGVMASATAAFAAEVEVIDRKPVANGAEVVLELVKDDGPATYYQYSYRSRAGIDWVFYRKLGYRWRTSEITFLKFNDAHVGVFIFDGRDCVVVTLDIDAVAPQMHEDRFYGAGGSLLDVDELELFDQFDSKFKIKNLKRDRDGTWWFSGIPYEKKLDCKVSPVPLPPMLEMLKLKLKADNEKAMEVIPEHAHDAAMLPQLKLPLDDNQKFNSLMGILFIPDPNPERRAIWKRMKSLQGSFCRSNAQVALPPSISGGRDFPLVSMIDMIRLLQMQFEFQLGIRRRVVPLADLPFLSDFPTLYEMNAGRATAADLPCYASDYDKTMAEIGAIYERWNEFCETRVVKSLERLDDVEFFAFIGRELMRKEE